VFHRLKATFHERIEVFGEAASGPLAYFVRFRFLNRYLLKEPEHAALPKVEAILERSLSNATRLDFSTQAYMTFYPSLIQAMDLDVHSGSFTTGPS
jgi:hypothetical protein